MLPTQYAQQGQCKGWASVRASVCPSHRSTAAVATSATSGFAAELQRLQQILINSCRRHAAGASAQQQIRVASCWLTADRAGSAQTCYKSDWQHYVQYTAVRHPGSQQEEIWAKALTLLNKQPKAPSSCNDNACITNIIRLKFSDKNVNTSNSYMNALQQHLQQYQS